MADGSLLVGGLGDVEEGDFVAGPLVLEDDAAHAALAALAVEDVVAARLDGNFPVA